MPDTQPRWFAGRKVTACRECPEAEILCGEAWCGLDERNQMLSVKSRELHPCCPLPIYEEETIVGVSPARLRQLLAREAALKAVGNSTLEWYHISDEDKDYEYDECPCCFNDSRKGHAPDCALAAAIEAAQEEDEA